MLPDSLPRQNFSSILRSKRNVALLVIVISTSAVLAIISDQTYSSGSDTIRNLAEDNIRSNTRISAHDLSNVITQRFRIVGTQLTTLTESPIIQNLEFERAKEIINDRQANTGEMTEFYMWLDHNGKMLWISNLNQTAYETFRGTDLTSREYFSIPKDTGEPYFSSVIVSNDGVPRMYMSVPVIDEQDMTFEGVMVAGMRPTTIGELLKSDLALGTESRVSLVDRNGIILYSRDPSLVGKDIFGQEVQDAISAQIPSEEVKLTNEILRRALEGGSGIEDLTVLNQLNTIAYNPIIFEGKFLMTLYVTSPHVLASNAQTVIEQQQNLNIAIILVVTAIAAAIAVLILTWNRQLDLVVQERTAALREANRLLELSNEQLKVNDVMQKEFINIAAHELRTPTQAILGYSELMDIGHGLGEKDLQGIVRNAKRLERLTEDILDVSRIESNSLKLKKERFSLNEVISSLISDLQKNRSSSEANKEIKFYFGAKYDTISIEADKGRITQAISNILNNAVKFSEKTGGTISVSLEKTEDGINTIDSRVIVSIRDEGVGIDPDIMPRLFAKFATNSEKGTGLGLYITKSIIEAHHGEVRAENNEGGKGATFSFSLPMSWQ